MQRRHKPNTYPLPLQLMMIIWGHGKGGWAKELEKEANNATAGALADISW